MLPHFKCGMRNSECGVSATPNSCSALPPNSAFRTPNTALESACLTFPLGALVYGRLLFAGFLFAGLRLVLAVTASSLYHWLALCFDLFDAVFQCGQYVDSGCFLLGRNHYLAALYLGVEHLA